MLENGIGSDVSDVMISDASWWIQCLIYNNMHMYTLYYIYYKLWNLHLFKDIYIYIYIIYTYFSAQSFHWIPQIQKKQLFWRFENVCSLLLYLFRKKKHFEKVNKGYPFGWLVPHKIMRTYPPNLSTPSAHLVSILPDPFLLQKKNYMTILSKSHSKSHESHIFCFSALYLGGRPSPAENPYFFRGILTWVASPCENALVICQTWRLKKLPLK